MKRLSLLLVVLAAGAACARTPTPEEGQLRVVPLGGDVRVVEDGETSVLEEATTVDAGVALFTGPTGRAEVELPGGSSLELAPDARIHLDDEESELEQGSLLVRSEDADIRVRAGGAEIEAADATFRVDRETSVILGVYSGEAAVPGAGVVVPELRQATVLQNGSLGELKPLEIRRNDVWDIELLGNAIDLGLQLLNLERGLTRQLPRGDEVDAVSAALDEDFSRASIREAIEDLGDAARAVVAAVLAEEIVRIDGGSRASILSEVVRLQAQAASWIVIVAQWGLAEAATRVLSQLGELAVAIAQSVAPPPAPTTPDDATVVDDSADQGSDTGDDTSGGDDGGDDGGGPPPSRDGGDGTSEPPPPPPEEGDQAAQPEPGCGNAVDCTVEDIIDGPGTRTPNFP